MFNAKLNYTWVNGPHSLKTGYEFQYVKTEVQDVNPLYGRDAYTGNFTRPAGPAANNVYNLADFMLGLRSQYALSSILIANLRQRYQFAYVQDDWRLNDKLTLNLGLRYEYATPWWEKDNLMTNYDPATKTMIKAKDGSIYDRTLLDPDRNNFGPRLGLAYSMTPKTVLRGGWGMSYIHFHRIGAANILAINGPQVVNAVVSQSNPTLPTFRTTQQGYPAGFADPSQFNPLTANILYMPRDYHSSIVQSWYVSVQREIAKNMLVDVAYVGNRADDLLALANYNQAVPNNSAGSLSLQARRPIQEFGDITYTYNDGKSRYNALQVKFEYRMPGNLMFLNAFTWSQAKDNGAGSLEGPNGNVPGRRTSTTGKPTTRSRLQPAATTTRRVSCGTSPSARGAVDERRQRPPRRVRRWLDLQRDQYHDLGRPGHADVHAGTIVPGFWHQPGVPRVEQLPAERERRPLRRQELDHRVPQHDQRHACPPTRASSSGTPNGTS